MCRNVDQHALVQCLERIVGSGNGRSRENDVRNPLALDDKTLGASGPARSEVRLHRRGPRIALNFALSRGPSR
jgi:hypothetical protein